jgi:hypothetical protein
VAGDIADGSLPQRPNCRRKTAIKARGLKWARLSIPSGASPLSGVNSKQRELEFSCETNPAAGGAADRR